MGRCCLSACSDSVKESSREGTGHALFTAEVFKGR